MSDVVASKNNLYGYASYIKLVELRLNNDIEMTENDLKWEREKRSGLSEKEGVLVNAKSFLSSNKVNKLERQLQQKKKWAEFWLENNWKVIEEKENMEFYKNLSLKQMLEWFEEDEKRNFSRYLVVQDAILAPIYEELPSFPKTNGIKEIDMMAACSLVAQSFAFPESYSFNIIKQTNKFIADLQQRWKKIIKYGTIGLLGLSTLAAFISGPIGVAIGSLMGYHGAAALTAGLAFLGGGALTAGGLGMAGGIAVILGSGAALGGTSGALIAKKVASIPKPILTLEMAKNINYAGYLANEADKSLAAEELLNTLLEQFISMKYALEKEILLGDSDEQLNEMLESAMIIHHSFEKLSQI